VQALTSVQTLTRRSMLLGAIAAPISAYAQAWPTIRLVVPYPPAGSTDVIARLVQPELQRRLGTTVIVENRPGASGSIGTAAVAKSPPDGSTWLFVFDNHAANPFVLNNLPFDTEKDLDPVLFIGTAPYVLATSASKPFKTLADVIAAARAKPDAVSYGSVGSGSVGHLAMALLSKQAGVRLVHVPYRGGGPAMNDAIAGHVDLLIGSTALAIPQIEAGTIRAVVQTGKARAQTLGAVVHLTCHSTAPGEVRHGFGERVLVGEPAGSRSSRAGEIAAALAGAGFQAEASADIRRDIWFKLWGNMTMNPVSALTGAACDAILDDDLVRGFMVCAMTEAAAIGAHIGCPIEQSAEARMAVTRQLGAFKTSMLHDAEAGRVLEIDALIGAVHEIGQHVGVPTPSIDALLGLVRLMARTRGLVAAA